ncbi:hypothetical protein O181_014732 [Austropuccinia psidii MF-1]|uniref:Uncharacterized protein n=1 Tax=Austropuccinia psidii MF-1 TaxID=1389203 RepID=A0A9Q3GQ40_9BASI|nr:hypothetical protein [Austropuccinia psidii MF-1]
MIAIISTPSQPFRIGMINICIKINSDLTLNNDNSQLYSSIIQWHNQHNIFVYLPNHQNTTDSFPGTLSNMLIPFLGAPQTFMNHGPGGAWIGNFQSNPTQTLFVEGVFLTDPSDLSSSQKPNLAFIFFTWYLNILFIIESCQKQGFKLKIPEEYDCNSHSQCQLFTPTFPASNATPPSYLALYSLTSSQEVIQLLSGSDLPMIQTHSSLIKETGLDFLWD